MRKLFILAFVANVVVTLISLVVLPPRVAIHFGSGGLANGWAPNYVHAILMTSVHLLIFCSLYYLPRYTFRFPAKWINLPNKEYWLLPANQPRAIEKYYGFIWHVGVAIFLLLLVISLLTLQANMAKPVRLNEMVLFTALGVVAIYTICWIFFFYRAFQLYGKE